MQNIPVYGRADLCIKLAQQVILTDEELLRELVKGQRLAVMLVDVVQHRIHHLIARADRPGIATVGGGAVQPDQQLHKGALGQQVAAVVLACL